jgi:SM-20-related protein
MDIKVVKGRCPHILVQNVLGPTIVKELFEYSCARERDFAPSLVKNRYFGPERIDSAVRDCDRLADLGKFRAKLCTVLCRISGLASTELGLSEAAIEPHEFEISRYADGGHFAPHLDTGTTLSRLRILSGVYYFAPTPLRFSGGALRLYALPTASAKTGQELLSVDIMPETDTLVLFPSWVWHEVLDVKITSDAWADGRFAINCWFHRSTLV